MSLIAGIGNLHHPISTLNDEAQKFFDQGLTLIYGFDFGAAVRSFERAANLDPRSSMPYWGIALASGPNYNRPTPGPGQEKAAYQAIQTARKLSSGASDEERAYVEALARRYSLEEKPDFGRIAQSYADAMRDLYHRFPDDPDVAALYAESLMDLHPWQLWRNDGTPRENTPEILQVLERALHRWPKHVGLNHFYIHAVEGSRHPEDALASARLLETLVPACSHLVHMPAHVYFRTGYYAEAVRVSESAVGVDNSEYQHDQDGSGVFLGYIHHNLIYLAASAIMEGDYDQAYSALAALASSARSELYETYGLLLPLRFGQWDRVLAVPPPDGKAQAVRMFWRYARGVAFAAKFRIGEAVEESHEMDQEYARIAPGRAFGSFFNDWTALHTIARDILDARIELARHHLGRAVADFKSAVQTEDNLAFDDLPDWYYPVRESLGSALYRAGRFKEAERVFREDLNRTPRNPRSLFGLWKTLQKQNRVAEAENARREFTASWKGGPIRIEDF